MNRLPLVVAALASATFLAVAPARAETVVSLPAGAGEHFSVENSSAAPLLRVDSAAVLSGTNVAFGTMGNNLTITVSNRVFLRSIKDMSMGFDSLVVGSNSLSSSTAGVVLGHDNRMFLASFASILGGTENALAYGVVQGGTSIPYHSLIAGGHRNSITGSQSSVISGGSYNLITNASVGATIAGGSQNKACGRYSTVAGGYNNVAAGSNSFAAGLFALANHDGSFVWADSSSVSTFASSNANEFAVRAAGGVRFDSELGATPLPNKKNRYADNNVVAWARVGSSGAIGTSHFGVETCSSFGQGNYEITLDVSLGSPSTLLPVATVDLYGMPLPTNAAQARLVYVERTLDPNRFIVRTTTGAFVPTNTPFNFIVTGR